MFGKQSIPYKHFTPTMTREEVRNQYRKLARLLHPDLHPDNPKATADMQALNAEYDMAIAAAMRVEKPEWDEPKYEKESANDVKVRQAIEAIIRFEHLDIEVCGMWVWVGGTVKGDVAIPTLKAAGYGWKSGKQKWAFAGIPSMNRAGAWDMDRIRNHYGSEKVENRKAETEKVLA